MNEYIYLFNISIDFQPALEAVVSHMFFVQMFKSYCRFCCGPIVDTATIDTLLH